MSIRASSRATAIALLVALLVPLYGARLGAAPLFDRDEAFYAESAREMVARHDWLTPWFNGEPRFDKPILYYWLQLGSRAVLGESEAAARLPSALAACALVLGTFVALDGLAGTGVALAASLLLALATETVALGRLAIPDATFALFLTGSWLVAFAWTEGIVEVSSGARALGAFLGLAILTKGLAAPVLVALTLALHRACSGPFPARIDRVAWTKLAAVAFAETCLEGSSFLATFFLKHHLERFVSGLPGHDKPWWYFATNVPLLFWPAVAYLPSAWVNARLEATVSNTRVEARLTRFAFAWFAVVLIFFSMSRGKLANYVFPALPAVAILAGSRVAARWTGREPLGRTERVAALVLGLVALGCVSISGPMGDWIRARLNEDNREELIALGWLPLWPAALLGCCGWLAARAIREAAPRRAFAALGSGFALLSFTGALFAMPEFGRRAYGPTRAVARWMGAALADEPGRILQYRLYRPTMVHYAHHSIEVTKDRNRLDEELAQPGPLFVATLRKHLDVEPPMPGLTEVGGSERVVVLANQAAARAFASAVSSDRPPR